MGCGGTRGAVSDLVIRTAGYAKGLVRSDVRPGIAMELSDPAHAKPLLQHVRRISGISTYGRQR
jgi:hypothetical protein